MDRPRTRPWLPLAAVVAALLTPGPTRAADEPTVDGRVGLGAMGLYANPGAYPYGAFDLRALLDVRMDADDLGRRPVGVRFDGDLYLDADDATLQTLRLLDAQVHFTPGRGAVQIRVGRQRVAASTEELVDGVAVEGTSTGGVRFGGYGGLMPDPFSTTPTVDAAGGGLVFGTLAPRVRTEAVAGFQVYDGAFDRAFVSVSAMGMPTPALSLFGRAKGQIWGAAPGVGLADAYAGASIRPARILRIRMMVNAYSSERYVDLVDRDPTLSRFAARADDLDLLDEIPNDELDGSLFLGLGGDVGLRDADRHGTVGTRVRYRHAPDPDDDYARVDLYGGAVGLGAGDAEIIATGRYLRASGRPIGQGELGLVTPVFKRRLDLGAYALFSGSPPESGDARPAVGVYGDLFLTAWLGKGWSLQAATRVGWEDNPDAAAVTVDGFLKVARRWHTVSGVPRTTRTEGRP